MVFDNLKKKAQDLAGQHGDKIEKGLDKAGKVAKDRFGHHDKVDSALGKAKNFLGDNKSGSEDEGQQQPGQQPGQQQSGQQPGQPGQRPDEQDPPPDKPYPGGRV